MRNKFKNAHISLAVGVTVLVVGFLLFHDNEGAMTAVGMGSFALCLGLLFVLDEREYRARNGGSGRRP
jgi:hypothetical protein